ncbi:caspase, EACC1-associated type [Nonomuraea spiralis]|uniref:caspase, EACC1-associated type n=1 Tax=Nonomuraea spiralis TaxID=46182 RepID=UPI0038990818
MPSSQNGAGLFLESAGARALLVGSGAHREGSRFPEVPAAAPTVIQLGRCLTEHAGLAPARMKTLLDPEDPARLINAVSRMAAAATTVMLFHFVGHGVIGPDRKLYLATQASMDLSVGDPAYQALPFSSLRLTLSQSPAELVVIVLDCCFAGRANPIGSPAGLDLLDTPWPGAYLLSASSAGERAWVLPGKPYTAFTSALIELLDSGDPAGPPGLTLDHVYRHLARVLPEMGLPRPRRQAFDLGGMQVLAPNVAYRSPEPPPVPSRTPGDDDSPYRGLAAYGAQDARYFFGRDELTQNLAARIGTTDPGHGPILVTGPSGSGKSSLLRAGVVPALRAADPRARSLILSPGPDPLTSFVRRVTALGRGPEESQPSTAELVRQIEENAAVADRLLAEAISANPAVDRLHVIVDQFEETFTDCSDERRRRSFVAALAALTSSVVVIALRSDFFGHCAAHPELLAAMASPFIVSAMNTAELCEVIEKPAQVKGLALEAGLVQLLLEDLGAYSEAPGSHSNLPLLSHALLVTWQHRVGDVLTLAAYRATGGITQAIANTADEVMRRLGTSRELLARRIMIRLVRLGDGTADTRRSVALTELLPASGTVARTEAERVLSAFVTARLITLDAGTAEIAHEALLRHWPTLRGWIENDRAGELVRQRLEDAAKAWHDDGRHPSLLDRGPRLDNALAWAETRAGELDPKTQEFLHAGVQNRENERRLERRRVVLRRWAIAGLAMLTVLASAGGGIALKLQADTRREQILTLSRQGAFRADAMRGRDPGTAAQLSLIAYRISPTEQAQSSLLSASGTPTGIKLSGHTGPVIGVAFRPDGRVVSSIGSDNTVRFWDVARQRQVGMLKEPDLPHGTVYEAVWSGDGKSVLVNYRGDAASQLWDVSDVARPKLIGPLSQTKGAWTTAVRHDGQLIAASGPSGPTVLFDARTPDRIAAQLGGFSIGGSWFLAFSPNGQTLLVTQSSWNAELWDVRDPYRPESYSLLPSSAGAGTADFSSDGTRLAVADMLVSLAVFDVENPAEPKKLADLKLNQKTSERPTSVSFSPDGSLLAAAYQNEDMVRIWDVAAKRVVYSLPQVGPVQALDFSPSGDSVATAGNDGAVRIWTLAQWPIASHSDLPNVVTFSPDGKSLASAGMDGVRIWDITPEGGLHSSAMLEGGTNNTESVLAFTADGKRLYFSGSIGQSLYDSSKDGKPSEIRQRKTVDFGQAAGLVVAKDRRILALGAEPSGGTGTTLRGAVPIQIWSLDAQGRLDGQLSSISLGTGDNPPAPVSLAMDPTGRILIGGIDDGSIRVWDVSDPKRPRGIANLTGGKRAINNIAIDPAAKVLAVAADDQPVRLWDISDPARPAPKAVLPDVMGRALKLAFDRRGTLLAVGGDDRSVRVFDVAGSPRLAITLQAHEGPVRAVSFSPVDDLLASVGEDNTVRLWDLDENRVAARICALNVTMMTEEEWQRYVPGLPYDPPCENGRLTPITDE